MMKEINYRKLVDFSNGKYSYNDYLLIKKMLNEVDQNEDLKEKLFLQWNQTIENNSGNDKSFNHIFEILIPEMNKLGFTDDDWKMILYENPKKVFGLYPWK